MTFVSQALSRRSGVGANLALDELLSGDERRAMMLLRTAHVPRQVAASLLAGIGDLLEISDPGRAIDAFDGISEAEVEDARAWLTAAAPYRDAVNALGSGYGKRTL
jgi:hypothetical protein